MNIEIIGAESMGVRGLCCLVTLADRRILIDPGVSLGYYRYGLLPHPFQVAEGCRVREKIINALENATDIVFSHFHGDHVPFLDANPFQLSLQALPSHFYPQRCWSNDAVTGTDYATIKYDTNGNLLWVQRYDRGSSDFPWSLAVDAEGNVYVTGYSYDTVTGTDYATIKYSEPVVTPEFMMEEAIEFYEEHLADGTIYGLGSGGADTAHEQLFGRMLDNVYNLILAEDESGAYKALSKVLQRIDGESPPPDLVSGSAASLLYSIFREISSELEC